MQANAATGTGNMANAPATTSQPRGRLTESSSVGSLCGAGRTQNTCYQGGGGVARGRGVQSSSGVDGSTRSSSRLLSSSKSSTGVRFSPPGDEQAGFKDNGECDQGPRTTAKVGKAGLDTVGTVELDTRATQRSGRGCDAKVASGMRRGSEMASWATCGAREKSAKDYLW